LQVRATSSAAPAVREQPGDRLVQQFGDWRHRASTEARMDQHFRERGARAAFRDEFRALVEGVALHGLGLPRETRIAALGPLVEAQRLEHGEHVDRELAQGEEMEEKL